MVLVGALVAGACQFIKLDEQYMPWVQAAGIFGALLAFIGGFWINRADRHASEALQVADQALERAQLIEANAERVRRQAQQEFGVLRSQFERTRQLTGLTNILREGIEKAITQLPTQNIKTDIDKLLRGVNRAILGSLGCKAGERWTLTIYREEDGVLVDMAVATVDLVAQLVPVPVRNWRVGHGFAGAAYDRDREIVLADAQTPSVLAMLNVPEGMLRTDDAIKYRSVAAVPIRVAGLEKPWGVVIATSDKPGRFDPSDNTEGALSAEAIRIFAGMLALLVAAELKVPLATKNPDAKN